MVVIILIAALFADDTVCVGGEGSWPRRRGDEPVVAVRGSYCGVMKAVVMRGLSDSGMVDSSRGSVGSDRNDATGVFPVAVVEKIQ
jgi:hypothetical protein